MAERYEMYDLVVVGAGFSGLPMAKIYHQVNPSASLAILDEAASLGGVWSKERLYPGLKTNNWFGSYEFSDFPMTKVIPEFLGPIQGPTVNKYLEAYAQEYDIKRYIQLQSRVGNIDQVGDYGWLLHIQSTLADGTVIDRDVFATKLVIASGTTSEPLMPKFEGQDSFGAPIFHSKEFGLHAEIQKTAQDVTVLSGSKSAFDAAYAFATSGVNVDWVIRKSGHGPNWMASPRVTPLKFLSGYLVSVRLMTWFSPCIWSESSGFAWIRKFLNQTAWGQRIVQGLFQTMMAGVIQQNGYDTHPELKKLKPWHDLFWIGTTRGILNYDTNFFQLVRDGKIRIHMADVERLSDHTVHLSNGTSIKTEAMICCTGWKIVPPAKFTHGGRDISADLGLPHMVSRKDEKSSDLRVEEKRLEAIDSEILTRFPVLRNQPTTARLARPIEPGATEGDMKTQKGYQLYRFMVPPAYIHARNIAFAGFCRSTYTSIIAQTQALWITAYFNGELLADLDHVDPAVRSATEQRIIYDAMLHNRFGKWRYPCGLGGQLPDFFFDGVSLVDLMFKDLGLKVFRKANLFREVFHWYGPKDYTGFVEEWLGKKRLSPLANAVAATVKAF